MNATKLTQKLILILASVFLMACGGGDDFGKALDVREKAATIIENNKDDLDKAAEQIEKLAADNKDLMARVTKLAEEMDEAEQAKFLEKYAERIGKMMEREMSLIEIPGFMENERLQAAMEGLD